MLKYKLMGERDPRKQPGLGTAFTQQPRGQIALLPLVATSQTVLREGKLLPSSASRQCSEHADLSQPKQTGNVQQFQAPQPSLSVLTSARPLSPSSAHQATFTVAVAGIFSSQAPGTR